MSTHEIVAPGDEASLDVESFLKMARMSRNQLWREWKAGRGPKFYRAGKRKIYIRRADAHAYLEQRVESTQAKEHEWLRNLIRDEVRAAVSMLMAEHRQAECTAA